jgi:hypothetical protein
MSELGLTLIASGHHLPPRPRVRAWSSGCDDRPRPASGRRSPTDQDLDRYRSRSAGAAATDCVAGQFLFD